MAHSYGFSNLVLPLLLHGIPLILAPSPLPEVVRNAVAENPGLVVPAVPALWHAWHEARAISPRLRLAISAGAPLPIALEAEVFATVGLKIHNFYGATECGGIAYDASQEPRTEEALVGGAMLGVELALTTEGCLMVRGPAVGQTFWPEASPTLEGGCFQTADAAELQGNLVYLRGRLCDLINVAGRKVRPETIEGVLRQHPSVSQCLVFGVADAGPGRAESIVACVVSSPEIRADDLQQFALSKLPPWQVPRAWWFVDALTPSQRGKLSRAEWRQKYLAGKGVKI